MPLTEPYDPVEISDVSLAFPADALDYMPPHETCEGQGERWAYDFIRQTMFGGLKDAQFAPSNPDWGQEDVDRAWRQIRAIMGSFAPRHEHKEDALAFLVTTWFDAVRWKGPDDTEWTSTPDVEWPS